MAEHVDPAAAPPVDSEEAKGPSKKDLKKAEKDAAKAAKKAERDAADQAAKDAKVAALAEAAKKYAHLYGN